MKVHKKRHISSEAEIPTASLADIVFLLLIFFLVTTSMNPDKGLGLVLPPPGEQVKLEKDNILSVYINAQGSILIGEQILNSVDELKDKVKTEIVENKDNPRFVVSLITDANAEYKSMIDALDEIKMAFEELKKEDPNFKERISLATPVF